MSRPTAAQPSSSLPRTLLGISLLFLGLSMFIGFLNTNKVRGLRHEVATTISAREASDRTRLASARTFKKREAEFAEAQAQATTALAKASAAEADLSKAQTGKAELEAKLQASDTQIAELQKRVADVTVNGAPGVEENVSPNEMKAMLDETKKQLAAAEEEKNVLAEKVKAAQDRMVAIQDDQKRRESGANPPGVHGTVLAVNQAYNFVVLNLGDRQGVVPNSEMLIMRQGTLIGKIRISSVEPATCIGDILPSSLARGVQVQPGDTVIYAGTNNS